MVLIFLLLLHEKGKKTGLLLSKNGENFLLRQKLKNSYLSFIGYKTKIMKLASIDKMP